MLDAYIKELIAHNNRVIIPNFGAFLLRATSKNKNKKELSDKIEDIYFSPFLKFNDELLVNHIMQKEGTDQSGAMDKINQYIKAIEQHVRDKDAYTIEGLGDFYMDDQGKIQFKVHGNTQGNAVSSQKQDTTPKQETTSAKTVNQKAAEGKKPGGEGEDAKKEPPKTPKPETTKATSSGSASGHKARSKPGQVEGKKSQNPPPPPKGKKEATREKSGSGNNRGLILSIAIGVPIAVLFIWAMLNFDTVQELFKKDNQQIAVPEQTDSPSEASTKDNAKDESKSETTEDSSEESAEPAEVTGQSESQQQTADQQTSVSGEKKYYLVAGSFKKKENAQKFREKLIDQGYNAEMIGERDGMHAVSYASFRNKSEAQSELRRLKEEKGLTTWLLYH